VQASPLLSTVRQIIREENLRERVAETCIRVHALHGCVQMPGTHQYYATDQESVVFCTDDRLFKDFTEGALPALYKALVKDDGKPCVPVSQTQRGLQPQAYKLTPLGRKIVQCCAQYGEEWEVAYANHVFHPVTTVLLRAMRRYAIPIGQWASQGSTQVSELARLLEQLARFVRRACGSWRFINALRDHERKAQANFDSARELIYGLAAKHSRLLILRIDLYYRPYWDADKARKAIGGFLRWLRSKACRRNLLPGYLARIIKCENGLVRGMHWHLLVICDANLQRKGGYLTRQLGEQWARHTGQGTDNYHNCWADRAKYDYDGLGVLELHDWEKMVGLRAALHYLTKQDCVLKLAGNRTRNFQGSLRLKNESRKRGRRRRLDDSLRLLERALGGKRSKYPPGFEPRTRRLWSAEKA
jgi:hypothetical protein